MVNPRHGSLLSLLGFTGFFQLGANAQPAPRDLCPTTCAQVGFSPSDWTVVAQLDQLKACDRPMVVDFSVRLPVDALQRVRACNVWTSDDFRQVAAQSNLWQARIDSVEEKVIPELSWNPATSEDEVGGRLVTQSVEHLQSYLENRNGHDNQTQMFATVSGTTSGVYVGATLLNPSVAESLFSEFLDVLRTDGIADGKSALLQVCDDRTGDQVFGLIATASDNFAAVHHAVSQWSNGTCVDTSRFAETRQLNSTPIAILRPEYPAAIQDDVTPIADRALLQKRADCTTVTVQGGDDCPGLIKRCGNGLTSANFYKYNPASNLCSTLEAGQYVCCTSGTLPTPKANSDGTCKTVDVQSNDDCGKLAIRCGGGLTRNTITKYNTAKNFCINLQVGQRVCCGPGELKDIRPKMNADGTCFAYQIKDDDWCHKVAVVHGLTLKELEGFNKNKTWAWNGCDYGFWPDNWICLSDGVPPFPAPIQNAVCGPQKLGSVKPAGSTSKDWHKINPCPLNACCNIWGQCGTTADFCVDTNTGAPGTAAKDTHGCISNCGMDIIRSAPPAKFMKLGYFEGFNLGRKCLNMDATQIDPSFTHVHFAFLMLDRNFNVYHDGELAKFQFERFKQLKGMKRIVSFGGWVFSAEAPNYDIFRLAVQSKNRNTVADNLVKFVVDNGLDGLDIDWEYPSAPDLPGIPGVPNGDPSEATDYLRLLALIRSKLPKDKTLSIAAPSSFWYLKQFPIKAMAELLDYIVYMTYDLHGQWDSGNQWSNPGCPTGNCLRSHINKTETVNALTMITKAGVPSNKVIVGVASYGRSFKMADKNCNGPTCFFLGDAKNSFARKGRCTDTAGYISNAEIREIGGSKWRDVSAEVDIMVDGDLWVSYMDNSLKGSRIGTYKAWSMGGTTDWAVDLETFHNPPDYNYGKGLSWDDVRNAVERGDNLEDCARGKRTGTWVQKHCNDDYAATPGKHFPEVRWEKLDCKSAWNDALAAWWSCKDHDLLSFSDFMAQFFRRSLPAKCDDLSHETNCGKMDDCVEFDSPKDATVGACAREIWNSMSELHFMLKNYHKSVETVGAGLKDSANEFIATFAPPSDVEQKLWDLFFGLIQVPLGMASTRFFGAELFTKAFFGEDSESVKRLQEVTQSITDQGFSIAFEALQQAVTPERGEIAFNAIYDMVAGNWLEQTDNLTKRVFDGSKESVAALSKVFNQGILLPGRGRKPPPAGNHTENWIREKAIERAFYALAIPGTWTASNSNPVVVDFGNGCDPNVAKYFLDSDRNNLKKGQRCINGRTYVIAGVRDGPPEVCGPPIFGNQCPPLVQWTFDVMDGMDAIQTREGGKEIETWGGVTVDDLIVGAVNTWAGNGNSNKINPEEDIVNPRDQSVVEALEGSYINIRQAGFLHIPVCGPEEAKMNLEKGRKRYGDSPNWPCNA